MANDTKYYSVYYCDHSLSAIGGYLAMTVLLMTDLAYREKTIIVMTSILAILTGDNDNDWRIVAI